MRDHDQHAKRDEGGWILLNVDELINRLAAAAHSRSGRVVIVGLCIAVAAIVVVLPSTWRHNDANATPAAAVPPVTGVESTTTAERSTTTSVARVKKSQTTTTTTVGAQVKTQPVTFPTPVLTTPLGTTPPVTTAVVTAPPPTTPIATTPPPTSPPDTGVVVPQ
jgi:hypothetical protein